MNQVQMLVSGKKVAVAIRSLIGTRSLQLECAKVLHEALLVPVLLYGSETMIWREKKVGLGMCKWTN